MSSRYTSEKIEELKAGIARAQAGIARAQGEIEEIDKTPVASEVVRTAVEAARKQKEEDVARDLELIARLEAKLAEEEAEEAAQEERNAQRKARETAVLTTIQNKIIASGFKPDEVVMRDNGNIRVGLGGETHATLSVRARMVSTGRFSSRHDGDELVLDWHYALEEKSRRYRLDLNTGKCNVDKAIEVIWGVRDARLAQIALAQKAVMNHTTMVQRVQNLLPAGLTAVGVEDYHSYSLRRGRRNGQSGWTEKLVQVMKGETRLGKASVNEKGEMQFTPAVCLTGDRAVKVLEILA